MRTEKLNAISRVICNHVDSLKSKFNHRVFILESVLALIQEQLDCAAENADCETEILARMNEMNQDIYDIKEEFMAVLFLVKHLCRF